MDLFRCVVLTISFTATIGGGLVISDNTSDWTTATQRCKLAVPVLKFSKHDITVDIAETITEDVWVGYYQARTAFEYFGCAKKDENRTIISTKADPGQCMSACGAHKIVGIVDKECFCYDYDNIPDDTQTMFKFCNKGCSKPDGTVCGRTAGRTKYISLYRYIRMDLRDNDNDNHNCLHYDHNGFKWDDCSLSYRVLCGEGNHVWIDSSNVNGQISFNWAKTTMRCFANQSRPSTHNNTQSFTVSQEAAALWTGIVRSQVIFKYTTDTSHLEHANMYGFLRKKDDGSIVLKLTDRTNSRKRRLCVNDPIATSSSTEISTLPTITTSSVTNSDKTVAPETKSSLKTESVSLSTTTAKNNDTTSNQQLKNEGGSSDVGAIVGATLSIVVIVVVVVVVLILRKRGFQLPFLKKAKQAPSASMIQNNKAYALSRPVEILQSTYHMDNEEYAEIDLTTTIDNEAKNGVINDAPESSDYAHDYFVLEKPEEEQYDSTKPGDQKSVPNTYNLYNTLSFEKSFNYDHVGADNAQVGNAGREVSDSENTYNTTTLGNSYLKTSGGELNNAYSMAEESEDTYNHTNVPRHQMGLRSSENDYDAI